MILTAIPGVFLTNFLFFVFWAGAEAGGEDVSKNDEFCIKNEKMCIKNGEFCIKNVEFRSAMGRPNTPRK